MGIKLGESNRRDGLLGRQGEAKTSLHFRGRIEASSEHHGAKLDSSVNLGLWRCRELRVTLGVVACEGCFTHGTKCASTKSRFDERGMSSCHQKTRVRWETQPVFRKETRQDKSCPAKTPKQIYGQKKGRLAEYKEG